MLTLARMGYQRNAQRGLHTTLRLLNADASGSSSGDGPSVLETALRDGLKTAMKSRDKPAAACLKTILADISYSAKSSPNPHAPSSQENVMTVIRRGISQRIQAAESYSPSSPSPHPENHQSLLSEISLLKSFLPSIPSDESIKSSIEKIIASLPSSDKDKAAVGKVLNALWQELGESKGGVDKKSVGKWVQEALKK